jgi:hypothetical protein
MADAQAEQESARAGLLKRVVVTRNIRGGVGPDADDAGSDHRAPCRLKQGRDALGEAVADAAREPQRAVAQLVELGGGLDHRVAIGAAQRRAPDADAAEIHRSPGYPGQG